MSYQIIQDIETVIELRNFSVDGFSKELGVSRVTVNNWLSGKKEINEKNIAAFYEYAFQKGVRLNKIKEQLYREELDDEEEILLFHGAKNKIEGKIGLEYSKKRNDFGNGFYCGESLEQSAMFVATYPQSSLYMLKFRRSKLKYKKYTVSREWMLMIAYYRGRLGEYENLDSIKKLVEENQGVDYIIAPIADNRMFEIIDQFIDGEITDVQCQHCLSATNLGNQYVLVSDRALKQVEILERCYLADAEKDYYLSSKQEEYEVNRDKVKLARKCYRNQGDYIEDILK
jgi:transcriptional regulator with XRE-family HTH domain